MDLTNSSGGFWGYIGGGRFDYSIKPPEVARSVRLRGMFSFLPADEFCPPNCSICEEGR